MPQLNPDPWFMTLTISWLIFLIIISTKTLNYTPLNELVPMSAEKHKTESWNWPW